MVRSLSMDLRTRLVSAVADGMTRRSDGARVLVLGTWEITEEGASCARTTLGACAAASRG